MTVLPEQEWDREPVRLKLDASCMAARYAVSIVATDENSPRLVMLSLLDTSGHVMNFIPMTADYAKGMVDMLLKRIREVGV